MATILTPDCDLLDPKTEKTLNRLLCELVWYFTKGLKALHWLRTTDGVKFIGEVTV